MPDFNTKKEILRRLRAKKERNKALWLPCTAAELCVKAWYAVICRAGLALSDKNGRFLGVGASGDKPKTRRQDDIVYVRKPLFGRVLSAVLAACFVMMFIPEMDMGFKVSAAELGTITLDGEVYYQEHTDTTKLYPKKEYEAARAYSVAKADFIAGNGWVKLGWNAADGELSNLICGYRVTIGSGGSTIPEYDSKFIATTNQTVDIKVNKPINVNNNTDNMTAKIYVYTNVPVWHLIKNEDGTESASPPVGTEYAQIMCADTKVYSLDLGILNKELDKPQLADLPDITEGVDNDPKAELKWDAVDGAYGYKIFRREGTKNWEELKGVVLNGSAAAGSEMSFTDENITPGTHYFYFVEAYAFAWGGNEYNTNNPGMITSSGGSTALSAQEKANSVYNKGYIKDFYVAPARPYVNPVASIANHKIDVTWKFDGNADGIVIVRSDKIIPDKEWQDKGYASLVDYLVSNDVRQNRVSGLKFLGDPPYSQKVIEDKDVVSGIDYQYYAIAYLNRDNGKLYSTCDSKSANMSFSLEPPQNLKPESADGRVTLTWDKVANADGYILTITKLTDKDGNAVNEAPVTIGNLKDTKYVHEVFKGEDILNGEKYEYKVQAYANVATPTSSQLTSDYCFPRTVTVGVPLNVPQDLKLTTTDGTINVSWTALKGAEGYILHYKYVKADGSSSDYTSKNVFDVAKTSYIHSGLNNGDKYTYYVEAYKTVNGVRVYSDPSDEAWIIVGVPLDAPKDFKGTTSDGRVDLTWSAVSGAQGYILHIVSSNGSEQTIDLSKPGFQHTGLNNGDVYTYYVQAYKTVNGIRVYSDGSTASANRVTFTVGDTLDSPKDFNAVTTDGQVDLSWTAVKGAEGYVLYAYGNGRSYQFDLSKTKYQHTGLNNGDRWTYYLAAYKTVNGRRVYSPPTRSITIDIGVSLNAAIDLTATAGNRQVDLSWSAVKGAEGYVVYLYNTKTMEFEPITVVSGTKYSHTGLKNGKKYTYMVAPFKTVNGERRFGEYSMSVDAIPSTGSNTDIDHSLNVRGTTPYGISHSEYISAAANHGAFDESVDVYFSTNKESTEAVKDVLKNYADGLKSFIIYPFDISIYEEGTLIEVDPYDGYSVTVTMPIPDRLIAYRDYITVVHIGEKTETEEGTDEIGVTDVSADDWLPTSSGSLEVLPSAVVDIDNVWCIQFVCSSFSPYAFVIYKEHILDVSAGGGVIASSFADSFNSGLLLFTAFPDILPNNKKLKVVVGGRKRYRIKSIEKSRR